MTSERGINNVGVYRYTFSDLLDKIFYYLGEETKKYPKEAIIYNLDGDSQHIPKHEPLFQDSRLINRYDEIDKLKRSIKEDRGLIRRIRKAFRKFRLTQIDEATYYIQRARVGNESILKILKDEQT